MIYLNRHMNQFLSHIPDDCTGKHKDSQNPELTNHLQIRHYVVVVVNVIVVVVVVAVVDVVFVVVVVVFVLVLVCVLVVLVVLVVVVRKEQADCTFVSMVP